MTDSAHGGFKEMCICVDDVETENNGEGENKNIFYGRLTALMKVHGLNATMIRMVGKVLKTLPTIGKDRFRFSLLSSP